jgi:hypothetical protein
MRMLSYETDQPLRQIGILLTPEEAKQLLTELQAVVESGQGYARLVDDDWGDLDISLYTPDNRDFLHRRIRQLIDAGE